MDIIKIYGEPISTLNLDKKPSIYIAPIKKLKLTSAIYNELIVGNITFISINKLKRNIKKKFKFPSTFYQLQKITGDFNKFDTFAIATYYKYNQSQHDLFIQEVNDALDILALSQLIFGSRERNAVLSFSNERFINDISFLTTNGENILHEFLIIDPQNDLILDHNWKNFQSFSFFSELLSLIKNKKSKVQKKWRERIILAAKLAGKSQRSRNKWLSFLLNMISLEYLLTADGDKFLEQLPKRVEAFIGWSDNWQIQELHSKVSALYKKRCDIVHRGDFEISEEELLLSDYFIFNILQNIIKHIKIFETQKDLILFSEKVQAEKTLGVTSKVRPKTLQDIGHNKKTKQYFYPKHIVDFIKQMDKFSKQLN
ncbi:HEPN domain-containing protein [Legionella longbeachae]|uniref:HEPN domain-containing protein n=1 Tax=Legionella longbeachae TaxID=450 RepID=UPI0014044A80|nr:HEPN domain-containing protein [Legionella longbeachae]QIN30662.1 hypothetical protein GCB94_00185 [Legionella longbeachae]